MDTEDPDRFCLVVCSRVAEGAAVVGFPRPWCTRVLDYVADAPEGPPRLTPAFGNYSDTPYDGGFPQTYL